MKTSKPPQRFLTANVVADRCGRSRIWLMQQLQHGLIKPSAILQRRDIRTHGAPLFSEADCVAAVALANEQRAALEAQTAERIRSVA